MVFEFNTTGMGHLAAHAGGEFMIFDGLVDDRGR
jgi:hypothetical protein